MALALADKPTHFVNFPLAQFDEFMVKYKELHAEIQRRGIVCKLQSAPHVSITMLDIDECDIKDVDIVLQETVDDFDDEEEFLMTFTNPHFLGRCLVLDVTGPEKLHDDVVLRLRNKGIKCDQSREWICHCTVAQFSEDPNANDFIVDQCNGLQFSYMEPIHIHSDAHIELVQIGASKEDGFYDCILSHWMGIRWEYSPESRPPDGKLGAIMGYCCLDILREQCGDEYFPKDDDDAWYMLSEHFECRLWFYRYVYRNSSYFRQTIKNRCCNCAGEFSSDED